MKNQINIYPIVSKLHQETIINNETNTLLEQLKQLGNFDIHITSLDNLYDADISLILVQSGGSERNFLNILDQLKEPIYLLTYGSNNSLAASMEILSYLKGHQRVAEILHGSNEYLVKRINEIVNPKKKELIHIGVIGKPSDWLIGSEVDYQDVEDKLGIKLVDIEIEELINLFNAEQNSLVPDTFDYNKYELSQSMKVYHALDKIVSKYHLKGFTIRCFDLLVHMLSFIFI